ncbi:MAG: hypothetical protein SVM80_08205 [Halobacteriota archaeon]|nr:hypothetical protein [Halobacteriota archaeon]
MDEEGGKGKEVFDEWMKYYQCDDPYWKISKRYIDPNRSSRLMQKFRKIEANHPEWADHLISGFPTYYAVLCAPKNSSEEMIKETYEKKIERSIYPLEVLEEAYKTLSDPDLTQEYDAALDLFVRVSQILNPKDKKDIRIKHEGWISQERTYSISSFIEDRHKNWADLFIKSAPTFYDILGVDSGASTEEIDDSIKADDPSDLIEEVYKILSDPDLRWEYDVMLDFFSDNIPEEAINIITEKRDIWDSQKYDKLMLRFLKDHGEIERLDSIMIDNGDLKKYLPPNKTFYDILGVEKDEIPQKDEEVENFLMERFLNNESDSEINAAFEALKDFDLRRDYDWMMENHEWINQLNEIMTHEEEDNIDNDS